MLVDETLETNPCTVSAWFPCPEDRPWELLAPHAVSMGSISVFGAHPDGEFLERCHREGISTLKLVGGEAEAFGTRRAARETIEGYLALCEQPGYGGIDLDFEHIARKWRERYNDFVRELSEELHARGKRLSICVGGLPLSQYPRVPDWLFYDPEVAGEMCDEVRVMCYDMYFAGGTWYGPTSTAPWARECMKFYLKYVPREKLIMGLPAYSNAYELKCGSGNGRQRGVDHPEALGEVRDLETIWSDYERIHIHRYRDADGREYLFFASDARSTRAHLETVDGLELPAISFWHYGTMSDQVWKTVREWGG